MALHDLTCRIGNRLMQLLSAPAAFTTGTPATCKSAAAPRAAAPSAKLRPGLPPKPQSGDTKFV